MARKIRCWCLYNILFREIFELNNINEQQTLCKYLTHIIMSLTNSDASIMYLDLSVQYSDAQEFWFISWNRFLI